MGDDITDALKNNFVLAKESPLTKLRLINQAAIDLKKIGGNIFDIAFRSDNLELIHNSNLKCTIDCRLRSFYFKAFHGVIAFNNILFSDRNG